jgi:primosomal protein N' (replication factor Y)
VRVVDALPQVRTSRVDLQLTYDAGGLQLDVGDVVRIPLGAREVLGFIVSEVREEPENAGVKAVLERYDAPRAFDETGLALARFVSERYVCTLGEALNSVTLAAAVPRVREVLHRVGNVPAGRYPSVPPRLLDLIWNAFEERFSLSTLLRHPEARRIGDRAALLAYVGALVRGDSLRRVRQILGGRSIERRIATLSVGGVEAKGPKGRALAAFVSSRGGVPRAEALLNGFSSAVVRRAVQSGALLETLEEPARSTLPERTMPPPTPEQHDALTAIAAALQRRHFETALLYGVTGSGKTYVYIEAIRRTIEDGGRAIVLVPEISLTPQTALRFEEAFGDRVAVFHSALSERERHDAWSACARGDVDVVVGARSAIFAPLTNVRLTIVDESHDPSYKQDVVPRYHAATVAAARMRLERGVLLLGSATPSLESYAAATQGRMALLRMMHRATALPMPEVRVVDMRAESESGNRGMFGSALVQALAERLDRNEKSILLVNRRGSAGSLLCRRCGKAPQCPRCSVALSVHRGERLLRCHYCDFQQRIPPACPSCGAEEIGELGVGTESVVEEVRRLFPAARVIRMDSDTTTRAGDHARLLDAFEREGDVLVGTQMVAKGLDFPTVTLAAVVAADMGLNQPDFRAGERSFALIAQVCGRSGRARQGEAIVQTFQPDHPAVRFAARHDYDGFAELELRERAALGFPPAMRLAYIGIIGRQLQAVRSAAACYAEVLRGTQLAEVLGPAPYPVARVNDEWRYRIALKTHESPALRGALRGRLLPIARKQRNTRLSINVDP